MALVVYSLGLGLCCELITVPRGAMRTQCTALPRVALKCLSHHCSPLTALASTGEVIKHGDLKCIYNEGMPVYKSPMDKGSLIIQFLVSCMLFCSQYSHVCT